MPYKIDKQGDRWCVIKDDGSGKKMGCHDTENGAQNQLRALYANEPHSEVEDLFRDTHGALGESGSIGHRIW